MTLEDIYVANILKCRPPENRDPLPEEIKAHTPWLIHQIKEMKPRDEILIIAGGFVIGAATAIGIMYAVKPGLTQ